MLTDATKFKFFSMNNVLDPTDLKPGESVDICNFDPDNDGGIATRPALVAGLVQQPVNDMYRLGGRSYFAVGNTVYCTVALSAEVDERFSTVISLDDMVTMILRVDGGLYVGSTQQLHFLSGTDPQSGGFQDVWSLPWGVIMGTGLPIKGEKVPAAGMSGNCAIFATTQGVVVGGPGGQIKNLSENRVSYPYGITGKATIREQGGLIHYLFTTALSNPAFNPFQPLLLGEGSESIHVL